MKFLKNIWPNPLHCFLVPVFFILHNYVDFYGLISLSSISLNIVSWMLTPLVLFTLLYFFFKNKSRAGIICVFLLLQFFFAVSVHNFLLHLLQNAVFVKWSVFLVLLFIVNIIFIRRVKKKNTESFSKLHTYISVCLLALITYDAGRFAFSNKNEMVQKNKLIKANSPFFQKTIDVNKTVLPDIYYVLFDMHGSTKAIREQVGFDNSTLDSALTNMNFHVYTQAQSSSNYTLTTMASVFNMSPLPALDSTVSFREIYQARASLQSNSFVSFLKSNGYKIINASPFPLSETDTSYLQYSNWATPGELMINQTLFHHLYKKTGWPLSKYFPSLFPATEYNLYKDDIHVNGKSLGMLKTTVALADTVVPKFFYGHLFIPHEPFKYDSNGYVIPFNRGTISDGNYNHYFSHQLIYCRKLMKEIAQKIINENKRPAVIIFQGDHAVRNARTNIKYETDVLNAIFFPGNTAKIVNDSFYTANTFRLILNRYFQQQLPDLQVQKQYITIQ